VAAEGGKPSPLRWLIGVELANYRKRAGLDQAEGAARAKISTGKLSHLETGARRQQPADIATVLDGYGAQQHEIDRLTSLAKVPDDSTWWGAWSDVVPDWFGTLAGLERLATKETVFEVVVLPGQMQTEDYALELTRAGRRVRADHSERLVELRMGRAQLLTSNNPLQFEAFINEQALRTWVGDSQIMQAQYLHLIHLAKRPNITFRVVVPERGPHSAATGQFIVLDFDKASSIAYDELQDGAMYVQSPGGVDTYRESIRSLEDVALPPDESVSFVEDLITKL
jgi:transcriptional regulator with XRE-family HTH domain